MKQYSLKGEHLFLGLDQGVQNYLTGNITSIEDVSCKLIRDDPSVFGGKYFYRDMYYEIDDKFYCLTRICDEEENDLTFDLYYFREVNVAIELYKKLGDNWSTLFISNHTLTYLSIILGDKFIGWYIAMMANCDQKVTNAKLSFAKQVGYAYQTFDNFVESMVKINGNYLYSRYYNSLESVIDEKLDLDGVVIPDYVHIDYENTVRDLILNGYIFISIFGEQISSDIDDISQHIQRPVILL